LKDLHAALEDRPGLLRDEAIDGSRGGAQSKDQPLR
jgi:hypothetical protein